MKRTLMVIVRRFSRAGTAGEHVDECIGERRAEDGRNHRGVVGEIGHAESPGIGRDRGARERIFDGHAAPGQQGGTEGRDCKFYLHLKNHIDCSGTRKEATSFLFKLHSSKIPSEGHSALYQQNNRSSK